LNIAVIDLPTLYLTYLLLLHYLGKQIKSIMITFSPINRSYTLHSLTP